MYNIYIGSDDGDDVRKMKIGLMDVAFLADGIYPVASPDLHLTSRNLSRLKTQDLKAEVRHGHRKVVRLSEP